FWLDPAVGHELRVLLVCNHDHLLNTLHIRTVEALLANGGDHVRPDAAFDRPRSKATPEGLRRRCRGAFQARRITGLDFVPKRSSFAVGNRRIAWRRGAAFAIDCLDGNLLESRRQELLEDFFHIVIAVRAMKRGGSCGKSVASACVTTSANSFSEIRSHTLKKKWPPGLSTRRASR